MYFWKACLYWITALALALSLAIGCSRGASPLAGSTNVEGIETDGDSASNGGGELSLQVQEAGRADLLPNLQRGVNLEILHEYYSPAEVRYLFGLLEQGLPIRVVDPSLLKPEQYEDTKGKPADVDEGRLLDTDRVPADSRIVFEKRSKRFLIQMDEKYVKRSWEKKKPSRFFLRVLAHELFRLGYYLKKTSFADNDGELSSLLRLTMKIEPELHEIWDGIRKRPLDKDGYSFGHLPVSPVGQQYEGVVNCDAAKIENWNKGPSNILLKSFCYLTLNFDTKEGFRTRGTMKYRLETLPDRAPYLSGTYKVVYDDDVIDIDFVKGTTMAGTTVFGDVLDFGAWSTLFRVDTKVPKVEGQEFVGTLFAESSALSMSLNIPEFSFDTALDIRERETAEVSMKFLDGQRVQYKGPQFNEEIENYEIVDWTRNYRQFGNTVVITLSEGKAGVDGHVHPDQISYWLRPGSEGIELVLASGDSLYKKGFRVPFQPLAKEYGALLDCSEVNWIPLEQRMKREARPDGGMGCSMQLYFEADHKFVAIYRTHFPSSGPKKVISGTWSMAGRHILVWNEEKKTAINAYKLLPDGTLSDTVDNNFVGSETITPE